MFSAWGEQFYEKGMGGTPQIFFADIAEACGEKWQNFIENREEIREELGLGDMYPSSVPPPKMQTIMDETGFRERLVSIGAWGGKDPKAK